MDPKTKSQYMQILIAVAIHKLRFAKHMSQDVLSVQADLPRSHVTMIENVKKAPTMTTLCRICDALEIPLSTLIRDAEDTINALPEDEPEEAFRALLTEEGFERLLKSITKDEPTE